MKIGLKKTFTCFAITLLAAAALFAQDPTPFSINTSPLPDPTGFVNDYAGVIDPATKQQLETKLKNLKDKTNPPVEIAIVIVKTTGDRPIFDYSLAVARGWKIGSKEDDNPSALMLVAIDDRKYFTQISRDLEDELPDGLVGSLQRQYLVPEFRQRNYGKGISDTVDAYIAAIEKRASPPSASTTEGKDSSAGGIPVFGLFCCAVIVLVILLIVFTRSKSSASKRDRDRWGGGGFGGGGSGVSDALPWVIGSIIANAASSSGSSSSGSDWGGSSSGWGGFGGGGDFGGGGAGGDW